MPIPHDWSRQLEECVNEGKRSSSADRLVFDKFVGDNPFYKFVLTEQASSWDDFVLWVQELSGSWCFRGQREAQWSLSTSLDRSVRRDIFTEYPNGITVTGHDHADRDEEGRKNLVQFREEASHIRNVPSSGDLGSWFALMQHYGTPTRFLDWTSSPFVAAYFAFEHEAQDAEKRSAIWALDLDWLEKRGRELLPPEVLVSAGDDAETHARWENRLIEECHEAVIIKVSPLSVNDRMAAQRGVLLCKRFHQAYFSVTLMTMMIHPAVPDYPVVRKLEVDAGQRKEFLERLRAMSIHRESLFPASMARSA
jgi:hypothetical protein